MDNKKIILWLPINITYNYTFDHVSFKLQKSQFQIHSIFFFHHIQCYNIHQWRFLLKTRHSLKRIFVCNTYVYCLKF